MSGRTGILGGTFDPIHVGHLAVARAAQEALELDRVLVVPSHTPPHRSTMPSASAYHRFAMAALAVAGTDDCLVSDLELMAGGISYTCRTLERLHATGLAPRNLYFLTGADAFAEIESWKDYPAILTQAHFVVVSRPGRSAASLRQTLPALAGRMEDVANCHTLDRDDPGTIFLIEASTPDVSATTIRQRLVRSESLTGLVTPAVEAHIRRHHLYRACRNEERGMGNEG
jgi:nicotinate-nucleotide adenylyltransferase